LSGVTTSYTYDASGNRTGESVGGTSTVTATYDGANELLTYDDSAANLSITTYNGLGLRTSSTVTPSGGSATTTSFTWDTAAPTPSLLMDSTNSYIYGTGGTPIEQVNLSSGTIEYLNSDEIGSVRGVVSSGGSLSASTSYDAWGNPETSGGLTAYSTFGYAGGYIDATQLIYLEHRYLDTSVGQFITDDPLVTVTGQPYSYGSDNPVNSIDPLGLFSIINGLRADANYAAGIANFVVSSVTFGQAHVSSPYSGFNWAYGVGEGYGLVAASILGITEIDVAEGADLSSSVVEVDAAGTNAAGDSVVNPLGGTQNCTSCVIAGDATLAGNPAVALDYGIAQPISVVEANLGGLFQTVAGRTEIEAILEDSGIGARGVVYGSRGAGAIGHVFNAINQDGAINFIDFQSGEGASFEGYKSFMFLLTSVGE
jgi:RHS repeat-associated protein